MTRSLETARAYDRFEPYWLGESFGTEELSVINSDTAWPRPLVVFEYGECDETVSGEFYGPDFLADKECSYPTVVANGTICDLTPQKGETIFRGAVQTGATGAHRQFMSGHTVIVIDAANRTDADAMAAALRPVSSDDSVAELEPPAAGSLDGGLPCQRRYRREQRRAVRYNREDRAQK